VQPLPYQRCTRCARRKIVFAPSLSRSRGTGTIKISQFQRPNLT